MWSRSNGVYANLKPSTSEGVEMPDKGYYRYVPADQPVLVPAAGVPASVKIHERMLKARQLEQVTKEAQASCSWKRFRLMSKSPEVRV